MAKLSLWLLGSFRAALDGEPVASFATDKAQALLAYLAVEADRAHRRDALAELLWSESSRENARRSLRQALYQLRQALGDRVAPKDSPTGEENPSPFLHVDRHAIQFNVQSDHWLDVAVFGRLAKACRQHRHRDQETCLPCLRRMEDMVALYEGEFLEHFSAGHSPLFEEWVLLEREWLHREAMEALVCLANYHERRGDVTQARRCARRQVEMEPWREEAHRQLMRLLALDGQRSAALAQHKACRQVLMEELGVEPTDDTNTLYERIRAGRKPLLSLRPSAPPQDLPSSATPFVGREEELDTLAELLASPDSRLVTIVGAGGIGKTRLALQAAADQVGNFPHGVIFVSLGPVDSVSRVPAAIADALGFTFREAEDPQRQLLDYLRNKELLLVLDSLEHILASADLVSKILSYAPGVIVLATSRERLNLKEESALVIQGLGYPSRRGASGKDGPPSPIADRSASAYSAVQLFDQHARRVHSGFTLSEAEMPEAVRICQLVEGLPLGLELAASWTRVRSCGEIANEIERNLDVLATDLRNAPERQRSIRATFEHSWDLLSVEERNLLARLSIFSGGFLSGAALQVTGASVSSLLALADKSLVRRDATGRYDMHSLLRQFAREKLDVSPRMRHDTEMRYASFFTTFLAEQGKRLRRARGREDFSGLLSEIENVRQAWQLAVTHDLVSLVEAALEPLYLFHYFQCRFQEGIELLSLAIDKWSSNPSRRRILGRLLARQGALYVQCGDYDEARASLNRGLALLEGAEEKSELTFALVNLARIAHRQGDYEETVRLSERSLALSRETADLWGVTHSLVHLGVVRYRMGDVDAAHALLQESLDSARRSDNPRLLIGPLNWLGDVLCHVGDYSAGRALFEQCLRLTQELGDQYRVAIALNNLGTVFHVLGKREEARSAYLESLRICREIGHRTREAITLSNLGELAFENGTYDDAQRLYQQGLAIGRQIRDQWIVMACLNNLGQIASTRQDADGARRYFTEALTIAQTTQTLPLTFKVLVNATALLSGDGEGELAAELLSLALRHRACEQETRDKAERRLEALGLEPEEEMARPLQAVVADVLESLSRRHSLPAHGDLEGETP